MGFYYCLGVNNPLELFQQQTKLSLAKHICQGIILHTVIIYRKQENVHIATLDYDLVLLVLVLFGPDCTVRLEG